MLSCYPFTYSTFIIYFSFNLYHDKKVNDKLYELYKEELLPALTSSASCTKHDKGNAAKAGERGMKQTRVVFEELDGYGTTTSALTFVIRKFKPTSSYPHQKSLHFLAHISLVHGRKAMMMMMWIWQQTVYCRGQRHLNLLGNHQWFLLMISHGFLSKLNDITYTKKRILSTKARKVTTPLLQNKHIQMEMLVLGILFAAILMPLITIMAGQSIANKQDDVTQIVSDIVHNVEREDNNGIVFATAFGFASFAKLLAPDLRLTLKLFANESHKSPTDALLLSRSEKTISFNYASEAEISNDIVIYIQVMHLLYRFVDELKLVHNDDFQHESNTNYSLNVNTNTKCVTMVFSSSNNNTLNTLTYDNIKIILSSLTEDLHFFILWDTYIDHTQIIDEKEPLWVVAETYSIIKRMALMVASTIYLYPNYHEVDETTKSGIILMKHGLFRNIRELFKKYNDRHFIHAQRTEESEEEKKAGDDDDHKHETEDENKHIDYQSVGKQIDFYFHVNGIQHYIMTHLRYSQIHWLCVIVKLYFFFIRFILPWCMLQHSGKTYLPHCNIVYQVGGKMGGFIEWSDGNV